MTAVAPWLHLIGIGEDGPAGLSETARGAVANARLVVGGRRHLELADGLIRGDRLAWLSPIEDTIPTLLAARGQPVCVLATGDPFHYGVGALLTRHIPIAEIHCLPQPSAFSLMAGRLGWSLETCTCLSLHGRALERIVPSLQPGRRILALSWDGSTPARLAALLAARGFGLSTLWVGEALGGSRERMRETAATDFALDEVSDLNLVAVRVEAGPEARCRPMTAGLCDAWFEHDGQITKSPVRAVTLAALAPSPDAVLWDIGAGSGSIAVEWLLACDSTRAIAIERDAARATRIARNATEWGVGDRLQVLHGVAPDSLGGLPAPDAVFVGGGLTALSLVDHVASAVRSPGRVVANAVTVESQGVLLAAFQRLGGDLTTISTAQAERVGGFHGFRPAMPVMQWRWTR